MNAYVCKLLDDDAILQTEIIQRIKRRGYQYEFEKEWLIGTQVFHWNKNVLELKNTLNDLVRLIDRLEKKYTDKDELVFA